MNGPFLAGLEFREQDCVNRMPQNGAFDHGAGVEPDDHGRVVERIEVVGLRPRVDREVRRLRPARQVVHPLDVHFAPRLAMLVVRPHQDSAVAQRLMAALPEVLRPADDEWRLGPAAFEQRRADVQHDRAIGPESDAGAEFIA